MNKQSKILIVDDKPENLFALEETLNELDVDKVIPCGLIINELLSNSLKYTFII